MTKNIFESLILAIILAYMMAGQNHFFDDINASLLDNMIQEETIWLFIVCGLMGSVVALI